MRLVLSLFALSALVGCANLDGSYVTPLPKRGDNIVLANAVTGFMALQYPPRQTTLILSQVTGGDSDVRSNLLTPLIIDTLQKRGFGLAQRAASTPDDHMLAYQITGLGGGDVMHLEVDRGVTEASRFFIRDPSGQLRPGGPLLFSSKDEQP